MQQLIAAAKSNLEVDESINSLEVRDGELVRHASDVHNHSMSSASYDRNLVSQFSVSLFDGARDDN